MSTSPEHFPYVFSDLSDLRPFESIRPEGTDPSQYWYQFWRGITYLRKYYSKRTRAAPAMAEHFDQQRALLAQIQCTETRDDSLPTLGVFGDLMWIRDQWQEFLSSEAREALLRYDALLGNLVGVIYPQDFAASEMSLNRVEGLAPEGERPPDLSALREDLLAMEHEGIEFRVVSVHWGFEYEAHPTAQMNRPAREIVCACADLIMGHHPHMQHPF